MPTPILMDWVVIAAYIQAAVLCFICGKKSNRIKNVKQAKIWRLLGFCLLLLGLNKFLYFENCVTSGFAMLARNHSWYELRRGLQAELIAIVCVLIISLLITILFRLKILGKKLLSAVTALIILSLLVIVRTISLHQIDALIFPDILHIGIGINWVIELSCNIWIGFAAFVVLRQKSVLNKQ